ncbi:MAG: TPR repeat protein [Polyangiales bacterium]
MFNFGCGMLGQMQATGAGFDEADPAAAYELLERSCRELGAFPCSVLGRMGAADLLGESATAEAEAALERACETGYAHACPMVELGGPRPE